MTPDLRPWVGRAVALVSLATGCGANPAPAAPASATEPGPAAASKRRVGALPDLAAACEPRLGQAPPEPLPGRFTGVARAAECRPALLAIMESLSRSLGVSCEHCHVASDFAAETHNKQVANWMARELVPKLHKRSADGAVVSIWCYDCHDGRPKLLGEPRSRQIAIDWMTTQLASNFESQQAMPPKCRDCHGGDLGSAEFRPRILLTELAGLGAAASGPSTPVTPVPDLGEQ